MAGRECPLRTCIVPTCLAEIFMVARFVLRQHLFEWIFRDSRAMFGALLLGR